MYKGTKVYICALEREDLPKLMQWRNRPDYRKFFREYREINLDMQNKWYETQVLKNDSSIMFAIRSMDTNELLGCCGLCYINWVHRNADLSLYIGKNGVYIDNTGIAEESCKLLFDYGFKELGLKKIWTEIYSFDIKKHQLYNKIGMHIDGVLRKNYFYDFKWWDSNIFSILSEEWD